MITFNEAERTATTIHVQTDRLHVYQVIGTHYKYGNVYRGQIHARKDKAELERDSVKARNWDNPAYWQLVEFQVIEYVIWD